MDGVRGNQDRNAEPERSRGQWFTGRNLRDIAIIAAIVIVAWKIATAPLNISIDKFSYTDLLALILALFSVWLSVMFYFKADEASSRFYDNTYRFTSDMHIVLGRIEATFGEKLQHLGEGQERMNDALAERLASVKVSVAEKTETVLEAAANLAKEEPGEAPATAEERAELMNKLRSATDELNEAKTELDKLRRLAGSRQTLPSERPNRETYEIVMRDFVEKVSWQKRLRLSKPNPTLAELADLFRDCSSMMPSTHKRLLIDGGYLDSSGTKLTLDGLNVFAAATRAVIESRAADTVSTK